ncbi:sensor histidine kinase [Romboutsia weinsteinii]|nr:ATP-binding protein [Romboutsia weinsteinii]
MAILFSILTYKESTYSYIFLIGSLVALSFRNFNFVGSIIYMNVSDIMVNSFIGLLFVLLSFVLVVIGVFFELGSFIKSKTNLEKELSLFYNLVNLNSFENIVFKDQNKRIFYANENTFNNYCDSNYSYDYLNKQSEKYDTLNFDIIEDKSHNTNNRSFTVYIEKMSVYLKVSIHKFYISLTQYYELIAFSDITKEYLLNLSCKKNEELLQSISDNIQDILIGITHDGVIEYANKAALDTLKYNHDDFIGKNYLDFISNNSTDSTLFNDTNTKHIYQVSNYYGDIVEFESIVKDLVNLEYSSVNKLIISKDLTERNKLDDITKKYNEIKAYEDSKNEFFANLSHELKTPLNIIYSTLQLFERMQSKDANVFKSFYFKYNTSLRINCLRILRLVNNLIDITKADVKSMDVNFVNLNIIYFVENITSSVTAFAAMKHLNIVFDTNNEEIFIKCDPEKIERILLNLLSNAIKFTPEHKTIYVDVIIDDKWVNIYVKDEGIGIDESMQELIFDRFVQIDKSLNRNTEGSGIGLSIVKSLVELHNGKISLKSSINKGTTFKISIPNISLSYTELKNNNLYNTETYKIELELSDIYEVF